MIIILQCTSGAGVKWVEGVNANEEMKYFFLTVLIKNGVRIPLAMAMARLGR